MRASHNLSSVFFAARLFSRFWKYLLISCVRTIRKCWTPVFQRDACRGSEKPTRENTFPGRKLRSLYTKVWNDHKRKITEANAYFTGAHGCCYFAEPNQQNLCRNFERVSLTRIMESDLILIFWKYRINGRLERCKETNDKCLISFVSYKWVIRRFIRRTIEIQCRLERRKVESKNLHQLTMQFCIPFYNL